MFLYSYPSKSLAEMMDMEVRARIHQIIAEEAGKHNIFDLPAKKNDIMKAVREDVGAVLQEERNRDHHAGGARRPDLRQRGDSACHRRCRPLQQLKVAAEAKRAAQEVENKTLLLAAEGKALAAKREAESKTEVEQVRAESDARIRIREAQAQAEAVRHVADARAYESAKANEQPDTYWRIRQIEAEMQRYKQWDGRYPQYFLQMGQAGSPIVMLPPLPAPMANEPLKTAQERK